VAASAGVPGAEQRAAHTLQRVAGRGTFKCTAQVAAAQQAAARQQARALPDAPALGRLGDGQALLERRVHALSARLDATEAAVEQRTDQLAEATEQLQVQASLQASGAGSSLEPLGYVCSGGRRTPRGLAASYHIKEYRILPGPEAYTDGLQQALERAAHLRVAGEVRRVPPKRQPACAGSPDRNRGVCARAAARATWLSCTA